MSLLPRARPIACAAGIAAVLAGGTPRAQDGPDGLRVGSFLVAPRVAAGTTYDSNLFRMPSATDTVRVTLAPDVVIRSDWGRHALKVEAGAEAGFHTHSDNDDYLDANFRVSGELDISRRFRLGIAAGILRGHDPRSSDDVPAGIAEPVRFVAWDVRLTAEAELGRFRLAPFATWRQVDFGDAPLSGGGKADQDTRDRREAGAGVELGYAPGRAWELLVRTSVFDIDYRQPGSTAGPARDALGLSALAGIRLKLTRLVEGRITAGLVRHDYRAPALADVTTLAVRTDLDWQPTRRLSVAFDAGRTVAETAVAGAAGRISTTAGLRLDYELLRTLTVDAGGRLGHDRYRGIARTDLGLSFALGADWSPMRGVSIRPEYVFSRTASDAPGQDHSAHVLSLLATYKFGAKR